MQSAAVKMSLNGKRLTTRDCTVRIVGMRRAVRRERMTATPDGDCVPDGFDPRLPLPTDVPPRRSSEREDDPPRAAVPLLCDAGRVPWLFCCCARYFADISGVIF